MSVKAFCNKRHGEPSDFLQKTQQLRFKMEASTVRDDVAALNLLGRQMSISICIYGIRSANEVIEQGRASDGQRETSHSGAPATPSAETLGDKE